MLTITLVGCVVDEHCHGNPACAEYVHCVYCLLFMLTVTIVTVILLYSFLRPGKLRAHAHKETDIITKPKCPVYDQGFVFEKVTLETLSTDHVLEITIWDAKYSAQPMGVLRLGPRPNQNSNKPWMDSQVGVAVYEMMFTMYGIYFGGILLMAW